METLIFILQQPYDMTELFGPALSAVDIEYGLLGKRSRRKRAVKPVSSVSETACKKLPHTDLRYRTEDCQYQEISHSSLLHAQSSRETLL